MSSKRVNQSRNVVLTWLVNDETNGVKQQNIIVPFAVDEIRVVKAGATPYNDSKVQGNISVRFESPDLCGGCGTILDVVRVVSRTFTRNNDNPVIDVDVRNDSANSFNTLTRYVFPPTAKRNVNGTFTFAARDLAGEALDLTQVDDFVATLVLEFIQYEEEDRARFDNDLQTMVKSGRRRL